MYSHLSGEKAFYLCLFLGVLGIHRVYARRYFTAIIYMLTAGLLGIGIIYDLIKIGKSKFMDGDKLPLKTVFKKVDKYFFLPMIGILLVLLYSLKFSLLSNSNSTLTKFFEDYNPTYVDSLNSKAESFKNEGKLKLLKKW